jgi:DDE family transposase
VPTSLSSPPVLLHVICESGLSPERLGSAESVGLLQALASVPDPRDARGRRHSLQSVLLLAVGAVLAGARSYAAIAQWAHCAEQAVVVCGPMPHASTFGRVLAAFGAGALQAVLTGWVLGRRTARSGQRAHSAQPRGESRAALAVDGKTLRGARTDAGGQTKLVAGFDHTDGDELATFAVVLDTLPDLREVVIIADAHCQRTHATHLRTRGAHYVFTV